MTSCRYMSLLLVTHISFFTPLPPFDNKNPSSKRVERSAVSILRSWISTVLTLLCC